MVTWIKRVNPAWIFGLAYCAFVLVLLVGCQFHGSYTYGVRSTSGFEVFQTAPDDGASFDAKALVEHIGDVTEIFEGPEEVAKPEDTTEPE